MRPSRLIPCLLLICAGFLGMAASQACASHVPPVLPLTSNSDHQHQDFTAMSFPSADLSKIDLRFADLRNCTFASGTNLSFALFTGADLTNANLNGCNIDFADFRGANLTNAILPCAGDADFRGAILTAVTAPPSCNQCNFTSNLKDQCTVGTLPSCLTSSSFRAVVEGVVFVDANANNTLDLGETGVAGVTVTITTQSGPSSGTTNSVGAYGGIFNVTGPASATVDTNTLPSSMTLQGPSTQSFDLSNCRSGQGRNFPVHDKSTPARRSSFGLVKTIYR